MDYKDIHIGSLIEKRVLESEIEIQRICKFFKLENKEIQQMYLSKTLDTEFLLKWCKILEYDFFRLYSQHLILYAPIANQNVRHNAASRKTTSSMPKFRKSIYTQEVIDFMLELIESGQKTRMEIINEYGIPKTTLYKWIDKYKN